MVIKSKKILSEISAGELLDKISILEIKLEKIKGKADQEEINKEYKILKEVQNSSLEVTEKLKTLFKEIKEVNLNLWNIEDKLRICEKNKDFGQTFIELARGVYLNNDKRSKIKLEINNILDSNIREIKQYANY
jgi:adenine C2-methylase RlmN of 23S rRNA A2503 and tRNA A37